MVFIVLIMSPHVPTNIVCRTGLNQKSDIHFNVAHYIRISSSGTYMYRCNTCMCTESILDLQSYTFLYQPICSITMCTFLPPPPDQKCIHKVSKRSSPLPSPPLPLHHQFHLPGPIFQPFTALQSNVVL